MTYKTKELEDEIERYKRELDNLVIESDGEPIMISIENDNEIGGVSYQGEFLELIRQHRNRVIKIIRQKVRKELIEEFKRIIIDTIQDYKDDAKMQLIKGFITKSDKVLLINWLADIELEQKFKLQELKETSI